MNYKEYIENYLIEIKKICSLINQEQIEKLSKEFLSIKGRLFILGVGGSASNASHAVNDFRKILNIEAYAITDNSAELTARINDDGWETSYVNWLKVSKLNKHDTLLIFSVSGGNDNVSLNLVRSMEYASKIGSKILSVVSKNGGEAQKLSNTCLLIPVVNDSRITAHAEEWQIIILHLIVNMIKK